jgi:hypothetical protein
VAEGGIYEVQFRLTEPPEAYPLKYRFHIFWGTDD